MWAEYQPLCTGKDAAVWGAVEDIFRPPVPGEDNSNWFMELCSSTSPIAAKASIPRVDVHVNPTTIAGLASWGAAAAQLQASLASAPAASQIAMRLDCSNLTVLMATAPGDALVAKLGGVSVFHGGNLAGAQGATATSLRVAGLGLSFSDNGQSPLDVIKQIISEPCISLAHSYR